MIGLVGACTSAPPGALDGETTAELSARAAARACGSDCERLPVHVRDQLLYADTVVGDQEPMPDLTRSALADVFAIVEFVDMDGADRLMESGDLGVLMGVSPLDELADGVVGVDVSMVRGDGEFRTQTMLFMWDGSSWVDATSEDTGVTVTSAVS